MSCEAYDSRGPHSGCEDCEKAEESAAYGAGEIIRQMERILFQRFGGKLIPGGKPGQPPHEEPALTRRTVEAWQTFRQTFEDAMVEDALDHSHGGD